MKVVYVLHSTDNFGGATKAFSIMLERLMANGIEPLVVMPDGNGFCKDLRDCGINTLILNYRPATYPPVRNIKQVILFIPKLIARICVNNIAARKLRKEAGDFGADLIHTNVSVVNIGMKAARRLGIPHITHIREYSDKISMHVFPVKSLYFRNLARAGSYTICITKGILRYYHLDGQKNSKVIYDGVLHESDAIKIAQKDNYFLFAGRLEEAKGISDLMKAYAEVCGTREDAFPLLVAGDSGNRNYVAQLHGLADSLNVSGKVKFLGNRNDVLELMSKASALIVPSRSEGFGFITAEAMFSGCLVIGKDVDGTKEQFDNGLEMTGDEIGLRYSDNAQLVSLMCGVMDSGAETHLPMIRRAQQTVTSLYTIEQNTARIIDLYKEIENEN